MTCSFAFCHSHQHPPQYCSSGRNSQTTAATKYSGHSKPYPAQGLRVPVPWLPMEVCDLISSRPLWDEALTAANRLLWLPTPPTLLWCWNAGLLWHLPGEHCFCWVKIDAETSPSASQASQWPFCASLVCGISSWTCLQMWKIFSRAWVQLISRVDLVMKGKKELCVNNGPINRGCSYWLQLQDRPLHHENEV